MSVRAIVALVVVILLIILVPTFVAGALEGFARGLATIWGEWSN